MSQSTKAGRRTPLTLGNNTGKSRKTSTESVDKSSDSRSSTPIVSIEKMNVDVDALKSKVAAAVASDNVSAAAVAPPINPSTTKSSQKPASGENGQKNGNKKENGKGDEKVKTSTNNKKEEKATKNGNNEEKVEKQNGNKAAAAAAVSTTGVSTTAVTSKTDTNGDKAESKSKEVVRESPRQKEIREAKEKEEADKAKAVAAAEKKEIDEALTALKKYEAEIKSTVPNVTVTAATPESKSIDKKPATPKPVALETSPTSTRKKSPSTAKKVNSATANSLLLENDMKGFTSDGEEMESLLMESEFEDSPMPKTRGSGKILKLSQNVPTRARVSPYRRSIDKIQSNSSTVVNLSTVSEQSTEYGALSPAAVRSDDKSYGASLRSMTGRKGTRPLREMTFHNNIRESYRQLTHDDSISSMNATVGSEIPNDSFRTPVVAVKGLARKRAATTDDDELANDELKESPKKARLDFSGFFGMVASPMTMLRNRFSRTKLQCSTPNPKQHIDTEATVEIVNIESNENVSGVENADIAMEQPTTSSTQDKEETDTVSEDTTAVINDDAEAEQQNNSIDEIKDKLDEEDEAGITIQEPKKSRCNVM